MGVKPEKPENMAPHSKQTVMKVESTEAGPSAEAAQVLERLKRDVEQLGRQGVQTLGDLMKTLGQTPRAHQLRQKLGEARATNSPRRSRGRRHADRFV
jgi:hypothetical protein